MPTGSPGSVTRPARRGASLMEVLVATAVGLIVVAGALGVFLSLRKATGVGDLAGSLQEASLAMFIIQKDLMQAVQKPDPAVDSAVIVSAGSIQMMKGDFRADGSVGGTLVVYEKEATPGGNFRLRRRCGTSSATVPGVFRDFEFAQLEGPGGRFVRVTLRVATRDTRLEAGAGSSEEAVLTALVRLMGPEMLSSKLYSWSFLEALGLLTFLAGLLGL